MRCCWVHKTVNVLDKLPKAQHPSAKNMLRAIWMSATKDDAIKAMGKFVATYQAKYPKAVECPIKDPEERERYVNSSFIASTMRGVASIHRAASWITG